MNKLLVDTNVLVYAIDEDSIFFRKSRDLVIHPDKDLYTTAKNLSEFLAVTTRMPSNSLSIDEAIDVAADFKTNMTILYPDEKSYDIFVALMAKYKPCGLKIHDFEIISIAIANQINCIATYNIKDFEPITEIRLYSF
jgi:predicted nucleic acid-binding protein